MTLSGEGAKVLKCAPGGADFKLIIETQRIQEELGLSLFLPKGIPMDTLPQEGSPSTQGLAGMWQAGRNRAKPVPARICFPYVCSSSYL